MERHNRQLPIPPIAINDEQARELIRVWACQGQQHVTIASGFWTDPAAWGVMLVDLAKHISNAYEQTTDMSSSNALLRIKNGFDAEWGDETDHPSGTIAND